MGDLVFRWLYHPPSRPLEGRRAAIYRLAATSNPLILPTHLFEKDIYILGVRLTPLPPNPCTIVLTCPNICIRDA